MNSKKKYFLTNNSLVESSLSLYSHFLPAFYLLESTLKDKLFECLKNELGDEWFAKQLEAEIIDPLFKSEKQLILLRKPKEFKLTDRGLLYESGFGFWVEFFNTRIYKISKGRPIKIFTALPKEIKRKDIYERLIKAKEFRNNLYHSRAPLITENNQIQYLDSVLENYKTVVDLLRWMGNPNLKGLEINSFESEIMHIKDLLSKNDKEQVLINVVII